MNVIRDLSFLETNPIVKPVLTIGNFDGVHRGHLALFEKVKQRAKAIGGQSTVMTFEPHPIKVVKPGNGPPLITPTNQKLELIWKSGIEALICLPFDLQFASISAHDFVKEILVSKIGIKEIVVGYDYTFGHNREGNIPLLKKMGDELGFTVHIVGPVQIGETLVSSTSIRRLIQEGRLPEAKKLLGRDYQIQGTVIRGQNRGARLLGFPTANLEVTDELFPKSGVYAVTVVIDGRIHHGVTNIGYNPTFGQNRLSVETHVLDFSEDLLGKSIKVHFVGRIRDEKTFESVTALSEQIKQDIQQAKKLFADREAN